MRIKKKRITLLFLVIFFLMLSPLSLFSSETKTVKVGFFSFPGYHEVFEGGSGLKGRGYGFDFLLLLKRYTNLNFQYVGYTDSWKDMLDMLRSGEIDHI